MTNSPHRFDEKCVFCNILRGRIECFRVFEDASSLAFLDHRPLFPGHCLLIAKGHFETLGDLPDALIAPIFATVRLLARVVTEGMGAQGSFVAINNIVSQSVPHFHVHIVPRKKGDGLKGFFWPRRAYKDQQEIDATLRALHGAIARLQRADRKA